MCRKMKRTGIQWLPEIAESFSVGYVKQYFEISKDLSNEGEPDRVLKLARAGIVEKDVTSNEGQMAASYAGYNKVKVGDLLLNPMDLYSGANCNVSELNGVISPAYSNLRPKEDGIVEPKFYDYYFKTQYWQMAMFAHGKGVSFDNRWTLNNDTLRKYEIPVVPYAQQKKIVTQIQAEEKEVDALISNVQSQIEKLKAYKQSLITEVVTKGLNPNDEMKDSGVEWIGEIPKHWNIIQVKRITEEHLQGYYDNEGYSQEGYRLLRITDLKEDGNISVEKSPFVRKKEGIGKFILKKGDFCFARTGGAGNFGFISEDIEQSVFASYLIRFRFKNIFNPFLKYVFLSNGFIKELQSLIHGSVNQNLHAENIKESHIPYPPLEKQKEIVDYLDGKCTYINKLIAIKEKKIEKLNEYKKSLIYEYVTGKKEVI